MGPAQRRALEAAAALAVELGRAPSAGEVGTRIGMVSSRISAVIAAARRAGLVTPHHPGRRTFERTPVRLTARARLELGLPIVVYLAWPLPAADAPTEAHHVAWQAGHDLARRVLIQVPGAASVSPYLARHSAADRARLDAAAPALAAMSDAAIVYRDGLLLGRRDVAAAVTNGAHVVVMDDAALDGGDPWGAARLASPIVSG